MQEWISVRKRLPPKNRRVLCYCSGRFTEVLEYCNDDDDGNPLFWGTMSPSVNYVTHWMPLPKAPKLDET